MAEISMQDVFQAIKELSADVKEVKSEMKELKNDVQSIKQEVEGIKDHVKHIDTKLDIFTEDLADARTEVRILKKERV
ncbi:hypothetical protein [Ornithinibacillus halotolerans]|uniref:Uncharacterized protein n=1 Tax=Ornithinibacillus halotolerans TaxID=1274357 RepID=A0A916RRK6_9BACI|nr:hypothetical protein [Ornithinibacillus halotolerans]GGA66855.1 hypothetical protein GCM10008025_08400 [Ornithinibacillus halotolerans]